MGLPLVSLWVLPVLVWVGVAPSALFDWRHSFPGACAPGYCRSCLRHSGVVCPARASQVRSSAPKRSESTTHSKSGRVSFRGVGGDRPARSRGPRWPTDSDETCSSCASVATSSCLTAWTPRAKSPPDSCALQSHPYGRAALGSGAVVARLTLDQNVGGSNPPSPATLIT